MGTTNEPCSPDVEVLETVAILHQDACVRQSMATELRRLRPTCHIVVAPLDGPDNLLPHNVDVLIVGLPSTGGNALATAAHLVTEFPWVQPVFVSPSGFGPEVQALRSLSWQYVVEDAQLWSWLEVALVPLARRARARRMLLQAEQAIPAPPAFSGDGNVMVSLPQAEQRFRESYLRLVLASTRSQKAAAAVAGVPYTTLRSMIDKLLI